MQRPARILIVLVLLLASAVAVLALSVHQRRQLAEQSQALAVSVTQTTLSSGDATALLNRVHATMLADRSAAGMAAYIDSIPLSLGPLQRLNSISGSVDAPLLPFGDYSVSASYELSLTFARSEATAFVEMVQDGQEWRFSEFRVDAALLYN